MRSEDLEHEVYIAPMLAEGAPPAARTRYGRPSPTVQL